MSKINSRNTGRRLERTSICSPNPFLKSPLKRISVSSNINSVSNDFSNNTGLILTPNLNSSSADIEDSFILSPSVKLDQKVIISIILVVYISYRV